MLLVGSKALEHYIPLNRILHDWDIWMTTEEYQKFYTLYNKYLVKETPGSSVFDINGEIVEVKSGDKFTPNDLIIWADQVDYPHTKIVKTPWGECYLPDIQTIYDMKAATAAHILEWKHQYDLELMKKAFPGLNQNTAIYQDRLKETHDRVSKSDRKKYEFFHKNTLKEQKIATIPEYIAHDRLHELIADLLGIKLPTYLRITNGDVTIAKQLFDKLTHEQKIDLMMEESLVLALERWFIPQMVERGINYRLIPMFYNNNEASVTYLILKHVNIKGLIGEADYIVQFGRDHFNEIEKRWVEAKQKIKDNGGFPQWFYDELFALREKYRNGEKVGIHHG